MGYIEIDQSGKIEHSSHTILAMHSSETQFTIKIPAQIKQNIFNEFLKRHKKKLTLRMFSIGLCLLLKNKIDTNSIIIIDDEYPKHGQDIKQLLINYLKKEGMKINPEKIRFSNIGKESFAHKIAIQTFNEKIKPNEIVSEKEIRKYRLLNKRDAKA